MKILDISGENGISSFGSLSIKKTAQYLYKMDPSKVEDSSTGPISYINDAGELVTIPAESPIYISGKYGNIGAFHNYLMNPFSPATQTTDILGTGNYTLWNRGGSVTVSAGTATITGAGTATEGNPLHFSVTVAGTVNITVSGECTVFQLTSTKFSTEPFLSTSVSTVASRAGTIYAPMEVGDKLYSLLDGKADGVELLSNHDFSYGFTDGFANNWTKYNPGECVYEMVEYGSGYAQKVTRILDTVGIGIKQSVPLTIGKIYEITAIIFTTVSNFSITGVAGGASYEVTPNAENTIKIRRKATSTSSIMYFWMDYGYSSAGDYLIIINTSVKEVSSASFKLHFKLTPYFDYSDLPISTIANILYSDTQSILQFRTDSSGNGYIDLKDGTNTASVALDWEYGVSCDIEMMFGNNIAESADKMQLIVDSTASALTAFDGTLNPDTDVTIGKECDYPFFITKPTAYTLKQSDWR